MSFGKQILNYLRKAVKKYWKFGKNFQGFQTGYVEIFWTFI